MTELKRAAPAPRAASVKFLTFKLGEEEYGLEILKVQEIIQLMHVTRVPRTPDYVRGVINLRGKLVPVIELRGKFGMTRQEDTDRTCIIVVQVERDQEAITMGVLVDTVSEVRNVAADQIVPAPSFGVAVDTAFLLGMAKVTGGAVLLLDVDKVLTTGELQAVEKVGQDA
jgi:purine-binding chemotaxis protein CheW